jgi:hypothetical protein
MKKLITAMAAAAVTILALSACTVDDGSADGTTNGTGGSASSSRGVHYTLAQQNAIEAAKNYLNLGTGFSRAGLIDQLSSKAGNGFKRSNAVFAVNHIKVNWNKQAVLSAKNYLKLGTGFSRSSLIDQLSSRAGSQFTVAQATHAAHQVGY